MSTLSCYVTLATLAVFAVPAAVYAGGRHQTIERNDKPAVSFVPAARAEASLQAPVLSGLDYTAVAPPGVRLRVVEDEPYIYLRGSSESRHARDFHGLSSIMLRSDRADGGWYEARINLRYMPGADRDNPLRLSFDTATNYAYTHSMLTGETRGEVAYALNEVRSPLGLTDAEDKDNRHREYLAYSAALINPLQFHKLPVYAPGADVPPNISAMMGAEPPAVEEPLAARSEFPYQYVQGQLKVLRRIDGAHCLLTIDITASNHLHSLTLTENIARCVINRLEPNMKPKHRLPYLAYYPEYEPFVSYYDGEIPHPTVADLAEQPGEGCGLYAQPITGDVCLDCTAEPVWPARPYADYEYGWIFPAGDLPQCSHCLMSMPGGKYAAVDQLRLLTIDQTTPGSQQANDCQLDKCRQNPCTPKRDRCR